MSVIILCARHFATFFHSTDLPIVCGDKAGYGIAKAAIGNTAIAKVYD